MEKQYKKQQKQKKIKCKRDTCPTNETWADADLINTQQLNQDKKKCFLNEEL